VKTLPKDAVTIKLPPEATTIAQIAEAIPDPDTLAPRTPVAVMPSGASFVKRLLGAKPISRAHRCSALLSRGYVDIEAFVDEETKADLAIGFSSSSTELC